MPARSSALCWCTSTLRISSTPPKIPAYEKVIACLGYIIKDKGASIYTTISEYLIEGNHDFDPRYRVINNLNNIRRNLEVGIKQVIPKDFTSNLNLLFLDHLQKGEIEVNQIKNQLLRAIENDLDEGYYYFLQELSKKDEFQFLTPLITKTIFDYLFIKGDIRKNDSDSKFMETISTIAYLNKVNGEELGNLKNIKAFSVAMREIASILKISDKEHHNFKTLLSSLQRICRLKSAFLFLDDNHKEEVYQYFNQVIEEELFKDIHPDTKIAQTLIQNSFNDIAKDKEKMITISFE